MLKIEEITFNSNRQNVLLNIGYLKSCTNIVCSKSFSEKDPQNFEEFYKRYTKTSEKIFHDLVIKPNNHYVLHIPEQLRQWGPLGQVADLCGERLVGAIQNIQTNMHLCEFFFVIEEDIYFDTQNLVVIESKWQPRWIKQ